MANFEHYQLYFQRVSYKMISISAIWSYFSYVCIGIKFTSLRNLIDRTILWLPLNYLIFTCNWKYEIPRDIRNQFGYIFQTP